jgi:subtilase family serine protease
MNAILGDTVNKPNIVSISWGGPEDSATAQFRNEFDQLLQTAAHLGITVCVAAGDTGSADFAADDPNWDGKAHVDFPASSSFALACGGTQAPGEEALFARALRISIARFSKFSNSQRSILGTASVTVGLCVITTVFFSTV